MFFVCSVNDFSITRGPIQAKFCIWTYSGSECVFSHFGGSAAPGGRKKGEMKFSLLWESMGNFCILAVFERYLSNAWTHPHQILFRDNVYRRAPSPSGVHRPLGAGVGGVKNSKMGWSHLCIGQLLFLFFSALPNVIQYVGQRPAHILVENRQDRPRGFYRVGQKVRKNFEFFTISRLYVHISHKRLKIEAYKQRMEKSFIPPLYNCHGVLQGGPKIE